MPKGSRAANREDLDWAFGSMGSQDKAKYLATLFIEEIGLFIKEQIDSDFEFSKYAERLARTASDFSPLLRSLAEKNSIIQDIIREKVAFYIGEHHPDMICITAPFPGNVFAAFFIAKIIKEIHPECITVLGGGYANTCLLYTSCDLTHRFEVRNVVLNTLINNGIRQLDCKNEFITLSATTISDFPNDVRYEWSFNNQVMGTSSSLIVNKPGRYIVRVMIKNAFVDCTSSDFVDVTLNIEKPVCTFTVPKLNCRTKSGIVNYLSLIHI